MPVFFLDTQLVVGIVSDTAMVTMCRGPRDPMTPQGNHLRFLDIFEIHFQGLYLASTDQSTLKSMKT